MRIIGGRLKGKSINYIKNSITRPLKDSVKENIFNILQHSNLVKINLDNSNILDLYSGIGSFGIECISRGAQKVTFLEQDTNAINILKKNILKLSIADKTNIYNYHINANFIEGIKEKFNIFFLDPPFADTNFLQNLRILKKNKMFKKKHIVIVHREKKSKDNFNDSLEVIEIKYYGRSKIIFGVFG